MSENKYTSSLANKGFQRRPQRGASVEKPKKGKQTVRRLIAYFRPEMKTVIVMAVVSAASVVASVLGPKYQSNAIDSIVQKDYASLQKLLLYMGIAYVISGICVLAQGRLSASLSQRIVKRLRADLFAKIVNLPLSYTDSHSHGDIMSRMTNDADNISDAVSTSLSSLFTGVLTLIGTAYMMFWYSVPLAFLSLAAVMLAVILTAVLTKVMTKFFTRRQQLLGQVNGIVQEMVTNGHTVTAYGREEEAVKQFSTTADSLTRTGIAAEIISNSMGPIHNMFNNLSFVIVAVAGAWFALQGKISVGVISAFIIYSKQFSRPVNELAQLYGQIETAAAGAERIFAIMDVPDEDKSGEHLKEAPKGVIEFRHVNFSYVPEKQIIYDFNLKIEKGKKIALVGSTGSGKTTMINLLMRFYDIDSGEILLDGKNIKEISTDDLRDCVGIVLQDTVLFSDTVRNNLTYSDSSASVEKVREAAKMANADSMIRHLPDGYDTVLKQGGESLSQGQRQLLAIGRAFLSDPQVLILDEATSSVDTRTEKRIQSAMQRLMKDRTSLIIAHRLSTIQDVDQIIVMDQGRIVEQGNHKELLAKHGRYYELYQTQFAGNQI